MEVKQMEVIDKRGNKQANDWQVGDVICFES
nr:MAG TPA: RNA-binding protein [Bacteriophage sp.]